MKTKTKYFAIILLMIVANLSSIAQKDKARVIVAYINNFAQYTNWPEENTLDSFRIVLISGIADEILEFKEFAQKRKIKGKPVALRNLKNLSSIPKNTNIIVITEDKSDLLPDVYDAIENMNILLVSEEYTEKRNIMINLYKTPANQIAFEVNKANILAQNLTIDPEILLSGGTELDIASLYRKSQLSLRQMQKNMDNLHDTLNSLHESIVASQNEIKKQETQFLAQKATLAEHINKIESQQIQIAAQKQTLDELKSLLDYRQAILSAQQDSITVKNNIYFKQLLDIRNKSSEIEDNERKIQTTKKQIETLNSQIDVKNTALSAQSRIIAQQKLMLVLLVVIALLVIILVFTILNYYKRNKNKNKELIMHKQVIEDKLVELEQLNDILKRADQYKSIFLASMSHELRTPLNSIIGYTGILLMGMTGNLNEEQVKQLNKVKNNAKHLLSLINDILDISKIEADRVELCCEEFQLQSLIDQVLETIMPKALEKNLTLTTGIQEDMLIYTDLRRIKQVVLNLVSNAVNYSEQGTINISTEQISDDKLKISVKDTGIGIAESELVRLFQPFQQIDASLTKKNNGTGLGLYLSRKIMNMLGGDIYVKSELGVGSDFYIEIPIKYNKG